MSEQTLSASTDDTNNIIQRKIEKYIISFNLHKKSNIIVDLNKLQGYCDKLQNKSFDSIWIIK